jgi:two-component SAPR family response regulator
MDSFRERSAGKRVVLLYPWTNYRNLFLSHFLSSADEGLLYHRIGDDTSSLNGWVSSLTEDLNDVVGGFGRKTRQALDGGSPEDIGKALAADLGGVSKTGTVLFIDELDRAPQDADFDTLVYALVEALPKGVQLAFSSRLLNQQPWHDFLAAGQAVVLGTEYRKNDVMFAVEETPRPQLETYALGRGHAVVNGHEITNWDGALPRNLFFFFMDNRLVTRDQIFNTFWSNLSIKEATNVFHVTKRKISERISLKVPDPENYELTIYTNGFYMPSDKVVRHYDVDDFQSAVDRATITNDPREEARLYQHAVDLYKAPFLETLKLDWVVERRAQLKLLYAQALIGLGRIYEQNGDKPGALGYYIRALKETPDREDVHRAVMALYLDLGMPGDVKAQYDRLRAILKKKHGIQPSAETQALLAQAEAQAS